ncbi:hypothetical protein JAAARDRAFT_190322 [Jaapia argillacea MUCL 33604]|uniref:Uncharacterized protein n=1 Tax=Jaapia argillacea MUCL 33604 TaxID=933084 RepID=A0A067QDL1_9AGAM|nr:hypothetical protein JAAARDRAFT_190322 [Jaapia argillacea MUCL 33604]
MPFGPYLEQDLLSEVCKSTPTEVLKLECLMMEQQGRPTGLTETESLNPDNRRPSRIRGILTIHYLSWLSVSGRKRLEADVRKRDCTEGGRHESGLTLQSIYGDAKGRRHVSGMKIRVIVQGEQALPALFLTSDLAQEGLVLTTKDRFRKYEVVSMDVETYIRSELYLDRYHLLNVMKTISRKSIPATPLQERTIDYFVNGYIDHCAPLPSAASQRLIYRSDDEDGQKGHLIRPRMLRKPHRSEVLACFDIHSEWILEEHRLRRRDRIVDLEIWGNFVARVKEARKQAPFWASEDRYAVKDDSTDGEESSVKPVAPNSRRPVPTKKKTKQKNMVPLRPATASRAGTSTSVVRHPHDHLYNSEFSESSTPPASPYSSDTSGRSSPVDRQILAELPLWGRSPPPLYADFKWYCPEGCGYILDLRNPTDNNLACLGPGAILYLRSKDWVLTDPKLIRLYYAIVHNHWFDHVKMKGLDAVPTKRGKHKIVRVSSKAQGKRRCTTIIKPED